MKRGVVMFKHIFVALKFTPPSIGALQKAIQMAHAHRARLSIFHALDYNLKQYQDSDPRLVEALRVVDEKYQEEVAPLLAKVPQSDFERFPADPALAVCRLARQKEVDLIILGCHLRPHKMSLGRVDYVGITILEKAPCPVMLVPTPV